MNWEIIIGSILSVLVIAVFIYGIWIIIYWAVYQALEDCFGKDLEKLKKIFEEK